MKIIFILIGFLVGGISGIFIHAHITNTLWADKSKIISVVQPISAPVQSQEYRLTSCDTSIVIRNNKTTMMINQYFDKK